MDERKVENPTRKTAANISIITGGKNEKARRGALHEKLLLDLYFG